MNTVGLWIPVSGTASGRSQMPERYSSRSWLATCVVAGPQLPVNRNENSGTRWFTASLPKPPSPATKLRTTGLVDSLRQP